MGRRKYSLLLQKQFIKVESVQFLHKEQKSYDVLVKREVDSLSENGAHKKDVSH